MAVMEAMASRAETAMVKEDMEAVVVAMEAGTPEEGMVVAAVEGDIRNDETRRGGIESHAMRAGSGRGLSGVGMLCTHIYAMTGKK